MNTRALIFSAIAATSLLVGRNASASLTFCNSSGAEIWTSFGLATNPHDNQTCGGTVIPPPAWYNSGALESEEAGWFAINNGACATVSTANLVNFGEYFMFYAQNASGSEVWDSGNGGNEFAASSNSVYNACTPYSVVVGDSLPAPWVVRQFGLWNTDSNNNFTLTFN
jgi:uncharacterized membrane protein